MTTPEEMREIIAQLDFLASDHRYVAKWATERHGEGANDESGFVVLPHNPTIGTYKRRAECLERASAMLRSIAAEREAEAKWFDTNGFSDEFLAEIAAKPKVQNDP